MPCHPAPRWSPTAGGPTASTPTRRCASWPARAFAPGASPMASRSGSEPGFLWPPGTAAEGYEGRSTVTAGLIVPVVDEGLGNSAYLVDLGDDQPGCGGGRCQHGAG